MDKFAKPKHIKKTPIKKLKAQLDKLMSQFVIMRDRKCQVCGKIDNLTCGHLFTRGHMSTRWDVLNCNCQCIGCNMLHEYDPSRYTLWFINTFGLPEYRDLAKRFNEIKKWNRTELEKVKENLERLINDFNLSENVL